MYTNVTDAFTEKLSEPSRHFRTTIYENDTPLDLDVISIRFVTGTCGGSSLAVGCAFAAMAEFKIRYTDLELEGKELFVELGLLLDDGTYEDIPFGHWTAQKPSRQNDVVTFQAVDRIAARLNEDYSSSLTYPTSIANVISELQTNIGITIHCDTPANVNLQVPIENISQRGALSIIAATLLGNAWCDRNGEIHISTFNNPSSRIKIDFDYVKEQPSMDETASLIEGVKVYTVADRTDTWITSGSGHMIELSDVYMTQDILNAVASNIECLSYGGGSVMFMGNPLIDPSDVIYFKGNSDMADFFLVTHLGEEIVTGAAENIAVRDYLSYDVPCMEITQFFDGGLTTTITAAGSFEKTEKTYYTGPITEAIERNAKAAAEAQETASEALDNASDAQSSADDAMALANGKNKIYYRNSAPTTGLTTGDLWFKTSEGNAIYEYTSSGTWTLRQLGQGSLAANSVTAVEINVSTLSAISAYLGSAIIGGANNQNGTLTIKDASNNTIGYWNNTGINAQLGKIGPWTLTSTSLGAYNFNIAQNTSNNLTTLTIYDAATVESSSKYIQLTAGSLRVNTRLTATGEYVEDFGNFEVVKDSSGNTYSRIVFAYGMGSSYTYTRTYLYADAQGCLQLGASQVDTLWLNREGNEYVSLWYNPTTKYIIFEDSLYPDLHTRNVKGINFLNNLMSLNSSGELYVASNIVLNTNARYLYGKYTSGDNRILCGVNNSDAALFGYGGYAASVGESYFDGNVVYIRSKGNIYMQSTSMVSSDHLIRVGSAAADTLFTDVGVGSLTARYGDYNALQIVADSSGAVRMWTRTAANVAYNLLTRANNSGEVTTGGTKWIFPIRTDFTSDLYFTDYSNTLRKPVASTSADGGRVAYLQMMSNTQARIGGQNGTAGSAIANRTWTVSSSDIRLKEHIEDTKVTALDTLNAIRLRSFDWKSDHDHWKIGMIADEVEKIDPKFAVGGGEEDGVMNIKSIDTFYMMGYVIKAIQELTAENKSLKKKITSLERKCA